MKVFLTGAGGQLAGEIIDSFKDVDVRAYLRELGRNNGPSIKRKVHTLMKAASRWAASEDRIPVDVLSSLLD